MSRPSGFRVLTLDCYGTLIDWESGLLSVLGAWRDRLAFEASAAELLEAFAAAEAEEERRRPAPRYPDVLRGVHRRLAARFGVPPDAREADRLAASVGDWPAFRDAPRALARLSRQFDLVVVSNVDRASFARSRRRLGCNFSAVVTAEDVGAYKPDLAVFRAALERVQELGHNPHELLHVAQSLYHDHVPAKALGLATAWIDRRRGEPGWGATPPPPTSVTPDWRLSSLAELADRLCPDEGA